MYCRPCVKAGKRNTMTSGCRTYKTSSMTRHEAISDHTAAVSAPKLALQFEAAAANAFSEEEEAILKAIKTVFWMASENLPLSKYEGLMGLMKDLEVPKLECLKVSERIDYTSYYTANEILAAISDQIEEEVDQKIRDSPFITLLSDESTDITNTKRMTINARIVNPKTSVPETLYLRDLEYEDGTGEGLATVLWEEVCSRGIPPSKVIGFGSDGASVMTGEGKGVKGRLLQHNPHMIHIHCMAHRLALCTSQAAADIPMLKKYQEWLTSLFYNLKVSATRENELHKVQAVLDSPVLKYKEIHAVRWLSCFQAVEAVYRTLDPLIVYFHQRNAAKDPKAKGLMKVMASTQFVYITYLLMDVLPIVSRLCLQLQAQDLDVAKAKVSLDQCLSDLDAYREDRQLFPTHIEHFDTDVVLKEEKYEFKGHLLASTSTNLTALKSQFLNKLVANINKRFPHRSIINNFFILAMRTIHMVSDPENFGNDELEELLKHFGEEKVFKGAVSAPIVPKATVRTEWGRAKVIVKSMHYPVDKMANLWEMLTVHHAEDIPNLIRLAQVALCLPLHTADCERTFSQQNQILTKQRNRLLPTVSDRLLRVRLHGKEHDGAKTLSIWKRKKRILMTRK
ncbi:hypothetical protein ScPMuIL_001958 [Solemya velum]